LSQLRSDGAQDDQAGEALTGSTRRAKGSPPKKKQPWLKKEKTLSLGSKLAVVEVCSVDGDEVADE
jgi:hypothetical protein